MKYFSAGCTALALAATAAAASAGPDHAHGDVSPRALRQLAELAAGIARYADFDAATAAGWKQFGGEDTPLMGEHWVRAGGPDYVHGARLDFAQPSNLMYTEIGGRKVLTGVAYTVRLGPGEPLPEGFDGDADRWHVHDFEAALGAALQDRPLLRWLANGWLDANYRDKGDNRGRIAMVHAWVTLPNPDGVFADYNRTLPYLKLGLPTAFADGASLAAAKGLNLATRAGCSDGIDGALWIANADRGRQKRLKTACAAEAAHIAAVLPGGGKAAINRAGEAGWAKFDAAWQAELTTDQQSRIAAMTEHGAAEGSAHEGH